MTPESIGPDPALPSEQPPVRRRNSVRWLVWLVILLVFAAAFYLIWNHRSNAAKPAAYGRRGGGGTVSLNAATATKGDIGVYLNEIGTVTPVYTASITSQVSGILTAVHYREGQIVAKGDALVDIDARPYQATLLQAQGTLERDENVLAQGRMDLARYQDAWARKAIPKQTLDDQEKLVQQEQGTVKLDQGAVQYDQIQVQYCHITAPISGRVGLRLVDPGNVVPAGGTTPLAVITQIQPMTVIFTVPEDSLGQVTPRLHQKTALPVTALDRNDLKPLAQGSLLALDNQIDTTTGTVKARATFANKDNALYPNQFVNARLQVDILHGVTLIPAAAIQHNGAEAFVYVIENNIARSRKIIPGVTDGETAQVTGVEPGEVVAISSFDKLQDKSAVAISKKPVPNNPSGSSAP